MELYRSWDAVEQVTSCDACDGRITVRAESGSHTPLTILFEAVEPGALRVSAKKGGHCDMAGCASAPVCSFATTPVPISDHGSRVEMDLGGYRLIVQKQPFRWWIADSEGSFVAGEGDDDVNVVLWPRVKPMGPVTGSRTAENRPLAGTGWRGALRLEKSESIMGLGEKFTALDRRGQHLESWNLDAYGTGSERAYKNVPFFWSTRGYGVLFNTYCRVVHDIGNPAVSTGSYVYTVDSDVLDMVVFLGSPREVISAYTALTGRGPLPPYWVFGIWLSRCYYRNQTEAQEAAERMRAAHLPVDVLTMDGRAWLDVETRCDFQWDRSKVPDPDGLLRFLHDRSYRVCVWEYPYLSIHNPGYAEAAERGYFMRDAEGRPHVFRWAPEGFDEFLTMLPPSSIVDFTNPEAVEWYRSLHIPLLQSGVDVFKTDFGEQMPEDCFASDGRTGRELHNELAILYNKTVYEVTRDFGRSGPVVFARSGWAGSQNYPVQWGGDAHSTWEGMAFSLRGGLGYCSSGIPLWTSDVGGFYGPKPAPELYMRWVQFGAFCPLMRLHGTTPREPWEYGEEAVRVYRRYAAARYELLPYLYTAAAESSRTGIPVMRPLAMDYPGDAVARGVEDQFLLGEALMVVPMLNPGTRRSVYLPPGTWVDFWTGEVTEGRRVIEVDCPMDHIPVYARRGSAVPIGPALEFVGSDSPSVRGLMVFGEGEGTVYVAAKEDRQALRYEAGKHRLLLQGTLVAEMNEVRLAGLPEGTRVFQVVGGVEKAELTW